MSTRVFQPNFSGGIIGADAYARTDTTKYAVGVKDAVNMLIRPQGGMQNRPGFQLASGYDTGSGGNNQWNIPFTLSNQTTAILEFSVGRVHVIYDGAYVLNPAFTARAVTAVSTGAAAVLTMASGTDAAAYAAGELVYLDDPNGDHALGEQVLRVTEVFGATISFTIYDQTAVDTSAGPAVWGTLGAGAVLRKLYYFAHPYQLADVPFVRFAQDNLDMYLAHRGYAPRRLRFTSLASWALTLHSFAPAIAAPTALAAAPDTPAAESRTYRITAIADDTLEESLPAEITISNYNPASQTSLAWTPPPGAVLFNIYRSQPGGGIGYIGTTNLNVFRDNNIFPDQSSRPPTLRTPFGNTNDNPGVVSFVEQRLAFGSTNNQPQLIEASKTQAFTNFGVSFPSQASDALRFRLRTQELNDIRAMVSGRALFVFTSTAEWVITGNDNEGVLTPTSIVPRPESYFGSYDIEPLVVGDQALFVEPSGSVIRDFLLTLNPNAAAQSRDLTILVRDLFEGFEVTSWCYTQSPDRTVWVTLSNGALLSLCYMAEHDIWGWTRHRIGGVSPHVYQVVAAREGVRDTLYATIGRVGPGGEAVMVERLAPRIDANPFAAFFVDGGLTYNVPGAPTGEISGLLHLRGQPVIALVDGDVVVDLEVDEAGVVNLRGASGTFIHVGLPYRAFLETLNIDFETEGLGSMQGRYKAVAEVAVSLKLSRGVKAGVRQDALNELVEWEPYMVGGPMPLQTRQVNMTVDGDWMRDATVIVAQDYPLPMTVLGVAPTWEPGE